jgi:hypothetical protein
LWQTTVTGSLLSTRKELGIAVGIFYTRDKIEEGESALNETTSCLKLGLGDDLPGKTVTISYR